MSGEWVFHTPMALISLQWWMVNDLEFGAEIILFLLVLLCVRVHVVLRQGILLITATETGTPMLAWNTRFSVLGSGGQHSSCGSITRGSRAFETSVVL